MHVLPACQHLREALLHFLFHLAAFLRAVDEIRQRAFPPAALVRVSRAGAGRRRLRCVHSPREHDETTAGRSAGRRQGTRQRGGGPLVHRDLHASNFFFCISASWARNARCLASKLAAPSGVMSASDGERSAAEDTPENGRRSSRPEEAAVRARAKRRADIGGNKARERERARRVLGAESRSMSRTANVSMPRGRKSSWSRRRLCRRRLAV